jgi:hypothetical protein
MNIYTKRHLEYRRHFEEIPQTKTDTMHEVYGQNFS